MPNVRYASAAAVLFLSMTSTAWADQAVQVDVKSVLNNRTVITCDASGNPIPWQMGVDGDAAKSYSGYATNHGAACAKTAPPIIGLANDGKYAADQYHPEIVLNFSDADPVGKQTRRSYGPDKYSFDVPPGKYSRFILVFTNDGNNDKVHVDFTYDSGTSSKDLAIPHYYFSAPPPNSTTQFNLGDNLDKWGKDMARLEQKNHYIFGIDAPPDANQTLQKVSLTWNSNSVLTFWGATAYGTPTNAVSDGGSGGASSVGGAAGVGGAPTSGGVAGTSASGAGGASGMTVSQAGAVDGGHPTTSGLPSSGSAGTNIAGGAMPSQSTATPPNESSQAGCSFNNSNSPSTLAWLSLAFGVFGYRRSRRGQHGQA